MVEEMVRNYDLPRKGRGGRLPGWGGWDGQCRNAAPPARGGKCVTSGLCLAVPLIDTTTTDVGSILLRELITVCVY